MEAMEDYGTVKWKLEEKMEEGKNMEEKAKWQCTKRSRIKMTLPLIKMDVISCGGALFVFTSNISFYLILYVAYFNLLVVQYFKQMFESLYILPCNKLIS